MIIIHKVRYLYLLDVYRYQFWAQYLLPINGFFLMVTQSVLLFPFQLIYRHYATLYFVFCVDSSESELGILDLIQVE